MLGIKWPNTGVESTYRADILQIHHISLDFWGFFIVPGRFERSLKKHEFSASDLTFCISTSFYIFTSKKQNGGDTKYEAYYKNKNCQQIVKINFDTLQYM